MNTQLKPDDVVIIDGSLEFADRMTRIPPEAEVVYEVIRLISGVPVFIEAHLERLNRSLLLAGFSLTLDMRTIKSAIHDLADRCIVTNQNIRINAWQEKGRISWAGYFVESHYPESSLYLKGIYTGLLVIERNNPNAKVWQAEFKQTISQACTARNLYEIILVDSDGFISEGSRSNLFFTQGDVLITAPDADVLGGITREELIKVASYNRIELVKRRIHLTELESFDGAFITGTSIHLLPIARIDAWKRSSSDQFLIKNLMEMYEQSVKDYVSAYEV